ncbi:hypothetical protein Tco_0797084 [Tanacetum coccineum]
MKDGSFGCDIDYGKLILVTVKNRFLELKAKDNMQEEQLLEHASYFGVALRRSSLISPNSLKCEFGSKSTGSLVRCRDSQGIHVESAKMNPSKIGHHTSKSATEI